jgi:predicted nucleotidyltransferase/DNA-binding Lrp family transcriptional regulator
VPCLISTATVDRAVAAHPLRAARIIVIVMRLISSDRALRATLALTASGHLNLTDLARAIGATPSATQRAVEILLADGVVERSASPARSYRLCAGDLTTTVVALAGLAIDALDALAIGGAANPAVECMAKVDQALIVVFAARSNDADQARAIRYIELHGARAGVAVQYRDHDDVRRDLVGDPEMRERVADGIVIVGDIDRTFPDRRQHGLATGEALHRLHPALRMPSRRVIRQLVKRHSIERLRLYGSAVRSDFRPDSDIDVLVRFRPEVRPNLLGITELEFDLEAAFGRDVDLIREETLRPETRTRVDDDAVSVS